MRDAQPTARVLGVHLYDPSAPRALWRKLAPLIEGSDEVWCASAQPALLESAALQLHCARVSYRLFHVDNRWHDWSGYLAFLGAHDGHGRLVCCNDSLLNRRVLSPITVRRFAAALCAQAPCLVGELDTRASSIDLGGWSSACWVSTYLFSLQGLAVDRPQLESTVERAVDAALSQPEHALRGYLEQRRARILSDPQSTRAKLGAMLFERWLTRIATENGAAIVDFCDGALLRKFERKLERLRDG